MGVLTSSDVKTGQEILTHYGYDLIKGAPHPMPSDFPWYWDLKMKTEKSDRQEAEKNNKEKLEVKRAKKRKSETKSARQKVKKTKTT